MKKYNWTLMKNTLSFLDRAKLAKFILTSDKFTQGKKVEEFENKWSGWSNDPRSLLLLSKAVGADGITPALFLASGQRASGVHVKT